MASADQCQSCKGEDTVEQEQFVAEVVVPPNGGIVVEEGADHRGREGNSRHPGVNGTAFREESETVEPQEGTIGIASQHIDGVDDVIAADGIDGQDAAH